jgi:hypothetical protein
LAEKWKPIPGYEYALEVSSYGRVRSIDRIVISRTGRELRYTGRFLKTRIRERDDLVPYEDVMLGSVERGNKKCFTVHALVLLAFRGPAPEGKIGRHLNGDSLDNRLSNLRYGTYIENALDTKKHGHRNYARGVDWRKAEAHAVQIYKQAHKGVALIRLAEKYGVSVKTIRRIRDGESYSHLTAQI